MPSPFPGMNPYLERAAIWHDFHETFMPFARAQLTRQLAPKYVARIDEQVYIHDTGESTHKLLGRADVAVAPTGRRGDPVGATAVLEAPAAVRLPDVDSEGLAFIEIRDRETRELITVIELLSPSNKRPGDDREQYLLKRRQLMACHVNIVEIDLLRGGPRMPMDGLEPCDYCVLVSRQYRHPVGDIWPFRLREPLSPVAIPLRLDDHDARLDLKQAIDGAYDTGAYQLDIYDTSPEPPLSPEDAAWAAQFVPARPE
jgi:hypothetical protein